MNTKKLAAADCSVTEIVYHWQDGREEVRYRRKTNSREALELIEEVLRLRQLHGDACPYSYREIRSQNDKLTDAGGETRKDSR
jgi:hypothetical protein